MDISLYKKIQSQIKLEYESHYIYLFISNLYHNKGYDGIGQFFYEQAQEEYQHAQKFILFMNKVNLPCMDKNIITDNEFLSISKMEDVSMLIESTEDIFELNTKLFLFSLENEEIVSEAIEDICNLANNVKYNRMLKFIDEFVNEQIEEEALMTELYNRSLSVSNNFQLLYFNDTIMNVRNKFTQSEKE